jgi:hypothetical protein
MHKLVVIMQKNIDNLTSKQFFKNIGIDNLIGTLENSNKTTYQVVVENYQGYILPVLPYHAKVR